MTAYRTTVTTPVAMKAKARPLTGDLNPSGVPALARVGRQNQDASNPSSGPEWWMCAKLRADEPKQEDTGDRDTLDEYAAGTGE